MPVTDETPMDRKTFAEWKTELEGVSLTNKVKKYSIHRFAPTRVLNCIRQTMTEGTKCNCPSTV
jgi:hypothetical protein